jgi:tRNA(His) guanylyltransferase
MLDPTDSKITLGDRMKMYENIQTKLRFDATKPLYCRIDGRNFSKFTKGMKKPFDEAMSMIMIEVTKHLVNETGAIIGYTQSDEITLVWKEGKFFFDGRIQKMVSNVSSIATSKFLLEALKVWPEKCNSKLPTFDARIFELPSREEASNSILWRAQDAYKNSISMAAHELLGHSKILGKSGETKIQMMKEEGVDFHNYPDFFKYGTFVRPELYSMSIDDLNLPAHIKEKQTSMHFTRRKVVSVDLGSFQEVKNKVAFIFDGADVLK